ncbi:MAG: hypothetical protein ACJ0QE_04150 [Flavobacteriaceae bacterium]
MLGINSVVLLVCVVDTVSPETEKIAFETGRIVNISLPSGVPVNGTPRPIVDPLTLMLDGVTEDKEAEPPDIDNSKSETSKVDVALAEPP